MAKSGKPYLLNLTEIQRAFAEEVAWQNRLRLSEYFRELVEAEMQKRPDIVELVTKKLKGEK